MRGVCLEPEGRQKKGAVRAAELTGPVPSKGLWGTCCYLLYQQELPKPSALPHCPLLGLPKDGDS